jgi:DNA polymerase-1|tara:strand:+ start:232 stop:2016 length:1785 start_codon:yes stop_codon:yes gene_type:complete
MELVFDIETNGLIWEFLSKNKETGELERVPAADSIWCIVAIDESNKVYSFDPTQIDEGIEFLKSADILVGHNIIGFDIPIIKKLKHVDLYKHAKVLDTLTLSRLLHPTREGGHSLEKWGWKLNCPKSASPDFKSYSKEMLDYCIQDVKLNKLVLEKLRSDSAGFSKDSVEIEHETSKILADQEQSGFLFDEKNATLLLSSLNKRKKEVETEVHYTFKPKLVDVKRVFPKLKKDGTLAKSGLTEEEYLERKDTNNINSFMRQELQEFNLGSRKQIGEYLIDFGWKPKRFTPTGQPIVDEGTLKKISHIKEAQLIAEFLLLQKRAAQVESWLDAVKNDGRVHGSVICTGTITGRMAHRNPNMAQVPAVYSPFGKECRACWKVPEGYKLVGVDASGLELRMLAHYMNDKEYVNEIINGDIHTTNQKFAGLESRDQAKTFIYALIYGAGDEKLGSITNGSRADGKKLRERFFSSLPTLRTLKERVDRAAKKKFLKGLDGRKIFVRHEHAALNTLLQGGGAVVMKKGLILLNTRLSLANLDYKFVGNIHDEWQIEVRECQANRVGQLAVESIIDAGTYFGMRCPLDGEYKIGENWSETH